ncbi:MAG: glycoside hydrolase family 15 protein [bacterium]
MDRVKLEQALDSHHRDIQDVILSRQNPVTGLLPASTAVNAHGDYTDAWVRDNVYSILSVWALGQAYRRLDDGHPRAYVLGQSVVKLMRGLLMAMMGQADKVEAFKYSGSIKDALHAKYDTQTGHPVVGDEEWGHLQLDATSLFLLMLAQMTASGLKIVYTLDEVNFVQNLVHYISRTYCTPDYGIWERGNKINHGIVEVNASSVGMAKAALEAMSGFNLFGTQGGQDSVIHVVPSDIARSRITLHALLPRESNSKEVDAAVLSVIGYPAYAVEDEILVEETRSKIVDKLQGRYGCKRFLLDGHQTELEDGSRLHYEPAELKLFEDIESEWPLFFTYLYVDGLCRSDLEQAKEYRERLNGLFVEQDGSQLLPELYIVPEDKIEAEKLNPGSQERVPNENIPLVWAQSLHKLGTLLDEGLIHVSDIDPLHRRWKVGEVDYRQVMVAILAEDDLVKKQLAAMGILAETPEEVAPVLVRHAEDLPPAYARIGANEKMGLSGRPLFPLRTMSCARLFVLGGEQMVFVPHFMNPRSYLGLDNRMVDEMFRSTLVYTHRHWDQPGQPLMSVLIRQDMLDESCVGQLAGLLEELQQGDCCGVQVKTGRLSALLQTVTRERIDSLGGFYVTRGELPVNRGGGRYLKSRPGKCRLLSPRAIRTLQVAEVATEVLLQRMVESDNLYEQVQVLEILATRHELQDALELPGERDTDDPRILTLYSLVEDVYWRAGELHLWAVVRRSAHLLQRFDDRLEEAVTDIVIRQKHLLMGRAYTDLGKVDNPKPYARLIEIIQHCSGNNPAEDILVHEVVLHLAQLVRFNPAWFDNLITIRVWDLVQLIIARIATAMDLSSSEAYERLLGLAPHSILEHLRRLLGENRQPEQVSHATAGMEALRTSGELDGFRRANREPEAARLGDTPDWRQWRIHAGAMGRLPDGFHEEAWVLLRYCEALVIGDKFNRQNRLDSELSQSTTPGEHHFAVEVEMLLMGVPAPEYRQLNIEAISALSHFFEANPLLDIQGELVLDVIIGHAVRWLWITEHREEGEEYESFRGEAWGEFYLSSPEAVREAILEAVMYLLEADGEWLSDDQPLQDSSAVAS